MKVRNGFVSNSSSSSFILIVKEEDYQKALESFPVSGHLVDQLFEQDKALGLNVRIFSNWFDMGGNSRLEYVDIDESVLPEDIEGVFELYDAFEKHLIETVGEENVFSHVEDW